MSHLWGGGGVLANDILCQELVLDDPNPRRDRGREGGLVETNMYEVCNLKVEKKFSNF